LFTPEAGSFHADCFSVSRTGNCARLLTVVLKAAVQHWLHLFVINRRVFSKQRNFETSQVKMKLAREKISQASHSIHTEDWRWQRHRPS